MELQLDKVVSLNNQQLSRYISSQLNHFFPDNEEINPAELLHYIEAAEERIWYCFEGIPKKYFNENNVVHFDHMHSDQYCMYLYMLSNFIYKQDQHPILP